MHHIFHWRPQRLDRKRSIVKSRLSYKRIYLYLPITINPTQLFSLINYKNEVNEVICYMHIYRGCDIYKIRLL